MFTYATTSSRNGEQRASAAGFNLHLIKPVDLEALQQALSEAS